MIGWIRDVLERLRLQRFVTVKLHSLFDAKKFDLLTGGTSTPVSKAVVDLSLLERDLLMEQNYIIVHGKDKKVVKVQVQSGQVNEYTLRRAFQLDKELPVSLWKDDLFLGVRPEGDDFIYELDDNWKGQTYKLEWEGECLFRPSTAIVRSPGSSAEARHESPYPKVSSTPLPIPETINKWMFYASDLLTGKSTVVCIHPRYFVTRHRTHLQLQIGSAIRIFPANSETNEGVGNEGYEVTVVNIEESLGFIVLRSEKAIGPKSPRLVPAEKSESFLLAGFGDMDTGTQQLVYSTGIVHSVDRFRSSDKSLPCTGPLILGTVRGSRGDSGGACWSARGLIGIICGVITVPETTHSDAISEEAIYSPTNYISPATDIRVSILGELANEKCASVKASLEKAYGGSYGGPYGCIVDLDEP